MSRTAGNIYFFPKCKRFRGAWASVELSKMTFLVMPWAHQFYELPVCSPKLAGKKGGSTKKVQDKGKSFCAALSEPSSLWYPSPPRVVSPCSADKAEQGSAPLHTHQFLSLQH